MKFRREAAVVSFVLLVHVHVLVLGTGPLHAAAPAATSELMRSIALAEDQRDWSGGVLASALGHASAEVRIRAALATGRLQDSLSVPALSKLASDPQVTVRREAVFALGQVGHRSARTVLEGALADRDAEVVALAVEALGKLGEPAVTARLTPFLAKGTPVQRMRACESLEEMLFVQMTLGDDRAIDSTYVAGVLVHERR